MFGEAACGSRCCFMTTNSLNVIRLRDVFPQIVMHRINYHIMYYNFNEVFSLFLSLFRVQRLSCKVFNLLLVQVFLGWCINLEILTEFLKFLSRVTVFAVRYLPWFTVSLCSLSPVLEVALRSCRGKHDTCLIPNCTHKSDIIVLVGPSSKAPARCRARCAFIFHIVTFVETLSRFAHIDSSTPRAEIIRSTKWPSAPSKKYLPLLRRWMELCKRLFSKTSTSFVKPGYVEKKLTFSRHDVNHGRHLSLHFRAFSRHFYTFIHIHSYTDGGGCHARCRQAHHEQFGVQYLYL